MNVRLRAWDALCDLLFSEGQAGNVGGLREGLGDRQFQTMLLELANSAYVTAPLWTALLRKGLTGSLCDEIRDYLHAFYELNAERNKRVEQQLLECIGVLNLHGIHPMPLKGAAHLLNKLYADSAERFLADIDLLVPNSAARVAAAALDGIGFRPAPSKFDYSQHHHLPTLVRKLDDVAVEIHTAPVFADAQRGLLTEEIWCGAREAGRGDYRWHIATATDAAMVLFLHGEVVDRGLARCIVDLRGFLDLKHLVSHAPHEIDWERNATRAKACGKSSVLRRYLYVFEKLTGTAILQSNRILLFDRIYFALCRAAIKQPTIQLWAREIQKLTSRELMVRYSIGDNWILLNAYRMRALAGVLRNWLLPKENGGTKRPDN